MVFGLTRPERERTTFTLTTKPSSFKEQVKDLTIFYSKQRTGIFYKTLRNKQSSLHRLHKYSSTHANSPNVNNYISQIKELEEEISSLLVNRAEGAKVRAKVDILDNAEKPSRYFYRRERSRQAKKLINKLVDSNSSYTSQEDIMNHVKEFYSNLYSECTIDWFIGWLLLQVGSAFGSRWCDFLRRWLF